MAQDETRWSVEEVLPILRGVSLFEGLPEDDLARIAEIVRGSVAEEGDVLFEEGDAGDAYYIVFDGAVEITKEAAGGGEEKLAIRRSGEGFGEMALLDESPRSAGARALEATRLIVVDREDFRTLVGRDTLTARLLEVLTRALRALNVRFAARQRPAPAGPDLWDVSRLLQRGMLPRNAPAVEGYDIAAGTSLEEDGEGRTVWDAFPLADGRTALVSLLARGSGLPPSHHLAVARALLRELARSEDSLAELLRRVNEGVADAAVDGEHSVECGILVPSGREVVWAGAGRPAGAVIRRDGNFEELPSHGPPLGMMGGFRYGTDRIEMGAGDVVLVLSEASKGLFRGAADLVATLQGKPVGEVVATVHRALRKAREGRIPETTVLYTRKK